MRCFYLDAINENGSDAILGELNIKINQNILNIDASHIPEYTLSSLSSNRLDGVYKEKKTVSKEGNGITYQSHLEGFSIDVRDAADCWLRVYLEPKQSLCLPSGLYHRLYTDANHPISFLVHTYKGKVVETELRYPEAKDALYSVPTPHRFRELTCELCRQFYQCGWVTGTGGSISIRYGSRIYMTPSGVQKERIQPEEVFLMDISGQVLGRPAPKEAHKAPKLTDCAPLFFHAYRLRNAGAVIHSHDITCVLASALFPGCSEYRISRQEMIKGIAGHGYLDELVIPIIENTPKENELADSLGEAIRQYPRSSAVLVRDHGIYVWGDTWEAAKRHSECLHYLFNVSIQMHQLRLPVGGVSISPSQVCASCASSMTAAPGEGNARKRKAGDHDLSSSTLTSDSDSSRAASDCDIRGVKYVVLDIEGTTTPITFVKDVLFPYSSQHLQAYLETTLETAQTQEIMNSLLEQFKQDAAGDNFINPALQGREKVEQVVRFAQSLIAADRKIPALKRLQGLVWKQGYASGALRAIVYDDVAPFLQHMRARKVPVGIYSSGSRGAQQLLFQHTNCGDLRSLLSVYFDTTVGQKQVAASYADILLTLGCTSSGPAAGAASPSEVLFVTDVLAEAVAAREAGMRAVISVRPGNAPLAEDHGFPEITSFSQLMKIADEECS